MTLAHKEKRKKILFFLQDSVGGAERISVLIGKNIDKDLFDVRFYLIDRRSGTSIAAFIPNGLPIVRIANPNPLALMRNMIRAIRAEHPDSIFSSVMYLSTKFMPWRWLFPQVKVVLRCENNLYTFTKIQRLRIGLTYRMASHIIAQTQEMKDELAGQWHINRKKIVVLQNPIDQERIDKGVISAANPYPDNGLKHYVAVGRFVYQKGYDILVKAFCLANKGIVDADLYIIGDKDMTEGRIYDEIMAIAKQNQCESRIHCIGYLSNPYPHIKYADCFVLSSRWEGLPNVLIEALYLHTPVAATACIPAISRIVSEGVTGYLSEVENPESLACAMKKAIYLGEVMTDYKSASIADFQKLFY